MSKNKFKPGDTVKIVKIPVDAPNELLGTTQTIEAISGSVYYRVRINGTPWFFLEDEIEPYPEKKEKQTMKYKPGDKVIVKYKNGDFQSTKVLDGQTATIKSEYIHPFNPQTETTYLLEEDPNVWFEESRLLPTKSKNKAFEQAETVFSNATKMFLDHVNGFITEHSFEIADEIIKLKGNEKKVISRVFGEDILRYAIAYVQSGQVLTFMDEYGGKNEEVS